MRDNHITRDDSAPWGWDCDACGESGEGYTDGQEASIAADEHIGGVEVSINPDLFKRAEADPKLVIEDDPSYLEPECEVRVTDARFTQLAETILLGIRLNNDGRL